MHIEDEFMTLSPDASLLRILPVEILKLVTLSFYTAELLLLEHLGHLVWKDPVIDPIGKYRHSATFGDMMLMPAKRTFGREQPL